MLVHHLLERSAGVAPERPLLVAGAARATYGEIRTAAGRFASALVAHGIVPGDRVGIMARNSALYVSAYYGALEAGAIAVSLNTAADARLVSQFLTDAAARALVAGRGFAAVARDAAESVETLERVILEADEGDAGESMRGVTWDAFLASVSRTAPAVARAPEDPAMIVYTSGSTGRPRGATLSHRNVVANTRSIVSYLGLASEDRVMDVLPFHYVYGKSLLNTHVAVGGSLVVEESLLFPDAVLDRMIEEAVTGLAGVPSTFAILLNRSSLASRRFPTLRYVTQAGGAMPVEHLRRLMDALPDKKIYVMYGATEAAARLSYLPPEDLSRKIGSIGKAIPGVELDVVTDDGRSARAGETGEIVARGENIMLGYWNDPEETALVMSARGFHTGDLATRDDDGYLTIVGRKRDMIKSGANRIAAKEIEEVIVAHPAIEEAAVVGVPDEMLGEAVHAFVTPRFGAAIDAGAVTDFLRERLPSYKVPRAIETLSELPRTGSGKVDKEALRRARRS